MNSLNFKNLGKLLLTFFFIVNVGCDLNDPISAQKGSDIPQIANNQQFKTLTFVNSPKSLQKKIHKSKFITAQSGGSVSIEHGTADGSAASLMYGNSNLAPFNVYLIDPENPLNTSIIGQLAFASSAIAMNPLDGLLYYVGNTAVNGVYPVGVWDPATNSSTTLPSGSTFKPAPKLTCGPDGILYGVNYDNSSDIYTINTTTGVWSLQTSIVVGVCGAGGDIAVDENGTMYSLRISGIGLQSIDLETGILTTVGDPISFKRRSGLCFVNNGQLFLSRKNGDIYALDKATGIPTFKGNIGLGIVNDLAPVIGSSELSYAQVSLDVLPGTIDNDDEFSLNIETTEILGGVAITFGPHGTVFNQPVILNLEAHGIDFSGVDPNAIDIYYDNQETGQWELMARDEVRVNVNAGTIKIINALLPHFSRYAVGYDN